MLMLSTMPAADPFWLFDEVADGDAKPVKAKAVKSARRTKSSALSKNATLSTGRRKTVYRITDVGEFTPIGTRYDTIEPQVDGLIFVGEPPTENGEGLADMAIQACGERDPCRVVYLEGFKALPLDNARIHPVIARNSRDLPLRRHWCTTFCSSLTLPGQG